jgi:hypothetical protein
MGEANVTVHVLDPVAVALRLRITDTGGTARRNQDGTLTSAECVNNRTANARLPLPLGELPAGQYLLTLEAVLGERSAERLLRFEVR